MPISEPEHYQPYPFSREIGRVISEGHSDHQYAAHEVRVRSDESALSFLTHEVQQKLPYLREYSDDVVAAAVEWQLNWGTEYPNLS